MMYRPYVLLMLALGGAGPAVIADEPLVARVKSAIVRDKLAPHPDCLNFIVTRDVDPGVDQVAVLERHDPTCGGDPQIQHRLFEVLVDQKTHRMASDAADPTDGTMKVLP